MNPQEYIKGLIELCNNEGYIPKKFELFEGNKFWIGFIENGKEYRLRTMDSNFITF